MIFATILLVCIILLAIELIYYILLIPDLEQKPLKIRPYDRHLSKAAYITAYVLSLLRAPLGLLPYLTKLFIFFGLKIRYESSQSTYFREVINMLGDFVNLGISILLVLFIAGPPKFTALTLILYLIIGAELVRIITERVPITFSAMWQLIPHQKIALSLHKRQDSSAFWNRTADCLARYCSYYALNDIERTRLLLCALKYRAVCNKDLANRLEYINSFRIIPLRYGLRSGWVRDIAKGEVFIHNIWTNDPWLLIGMAIRRSPWMFDPRFLCRPFYYMTEANRLATLCVLQHARYSPPYAVFQFGHEIRVARLHFFYRILRWLGADIEEKVAADGTFRFDQFICWLDKQFGQGLSLPEQKPLFTDDEVIGDILLSNEIDESLSPIDIASRYTYPLKYVEEVLLDKINTSRMQLQQKGQSLPG